MVLKEMETASWVCAWLKLFASPSKKSASPTPLLPPPAVALPLKLYVPAVSVKISWFLCVCNQAKPNLKLCAPRVQERSSLYWLLRQVFVHGQFPLSMLTPIWPPLKSIPGTLLMVLAVGKRGVVVKPDGVCHWLVLVMRMLLPFSLYDASSSRLGLMLYAAWTTAAQDGTISSDPMVG